MRKNIEDPENLKEEYGRNKKEIKRNKSESAYIQFNPEKYISAEEIMMSQLQVQPMLGGGGWATSSRPSSVASMVALQQAIQRLTNSSRSSLRHHHHNSNSHL